MRSIRLPQARPAVLEPANWNSELKQSQKDAVDMLVVVAVNSDTILQRNQALESHVQRESIRNAAAAVAEIANTHQIVILHDCSPRQGMLALINNTYEDLNNFPVDILGVQATGVTGFLFEQDLRNALPERKLCTVSMHTLVDSDDPAFAEPGVPVGPVYTYDEAQMLANTHPEWMLQQQGNYYRRMLPTPEPCTIFELPSLRHLVSSGDITVICGDGGGIPVRKDLDGVFHSVPAIVNPAPTASLLAEGLEADGLIYLGNHNHVEAISQGETQGIREITPESAEEITVVDSDSSYKLESACHFVRSGGKFGGIGTIGRAGDILAGTSGTSIKIHVPGGTRYYDG